MDWLSWEDPDLSETETDCIRFRCYTSFCTAIFCPCKLFNPCMILLHLPTFMVVYKSNNSILLTMDVILLSFVSPVSQIHAL